ncbi:MAG: glycosyltransferase family 39 protein [Xanthobacteraceae bacterium]|nr:glycosyltransferase family 39 protein [Xanthobacteraceae bacterium]
MAQADLLQQPPTAVSRAHRQRAERWSLRDHLGIVLTAADRWFDAAAVALLVAVAIVAALTFRDYGLGWDDYTHSEYGALLLRLYDSGFADRRALSFVNLYAYGGGFDMFAALAAKVLPFDLFETRRLCGALIGIVGLGITWRIGRRMGGPLAGLIGLALLATCPLYYGHMFMNAKDAPFAVVMALMLLGLVRALQEYPAPGAPTVTIFGLGLGLSMGTRVLGDFAPIYGLAGLALIVALETKRLGAFAPAKRDALRFILTLLPALVLAYAVMALVWPWSVVSPLNPLRAVAYFSHFFEKPWKEMFAGVPVAVPDMPRTYVPWLFALTMPIILLGLGALGIAGAALALTRRTMPAGWRAGILVTGLAAIVPILVALLTRPAMYNGIRHFVFVTPPLAVVGGLAGAWIISGFAGMSRLAAVAASAVIAFGLAVPTMDMIRLHPYEYTHFNLLAGGVRAADERYMLDYWGLAFKQAADELRAKLQEKADVAPSNRRWRIAVCGPQRPAQVELGPDFVTQGDPGGADFAMMLGEFYCLKLNAPVVVEVERDGVIFARVYDIRGRSIRSLLTLPAP